MYVWEVIHGVKLRSIIKLAFNYVSQWDSNSNPTWEFLLFSLFQSAVSKMTMHLNIK